MRLLVEAIKFRPPWRCRHKWEGVSAVYSDYEKCWRCGKEQNRVARSTPAEWYTRLFAPPEV